LTEEETLLQGGIIETSDVELKDTFFYWCQRTLCK
jgi:hypothetical protein